MKYTKAPLCHGYANQLLTIDLGSGKINPQPLDPLVRDFFIGGGGGDDVEQVGEFLDDLVGGGNQEKRMRRNTPSWSAFISVLNTPTGPSAALTSAGVGWLTPT